MAEKIKFKPEFFNLQVLPKLLEIISSLAKGEQYELTVEKVKKKRSLNANNYMWQLCEQIAVSVGLSKDEVYRQAVQAVGVYKDFHSLGPDEASTFQTAWSMLGTGWFCEQADYEPDGERLVIRAYYGSSVYNTRQMSRLIDYIVQDAKALGIETMTPQELEALYERVN